MAGVQFNLLPDVKLEYIKTQRSKGLIMTVATIAAGAAIVIFLIVLLTVEGVQKKQLNDSAKATDQASSDLKSINNLSQILTVQNQLTTLSGLHHQKNITSRIFSYLPQLMPSGAHLGRLTLDLEKDTLEIDGTADSQTTVNTFVDTLKFTNYKIGSQGASSQAFTSVVESNFSITNGTVDYTLQISFDPQLFSNNLSDVPTLEVPSQTTTRSVLEDPSHDLFNGQSGSQTTGGQ